MLENGLTISSVLLIIHSLINNHLKINDTSEKKLKIFW